MLRNRVYVGEIVHKDKTYPGAHLPIIEPQLFAAVAAMIAAHTPTRRPRAAKASFALTGLIFDGAGMRMSPTSMRRRDEVYRYYVSANLQRGLLDEPHRPDEEKIHRVAADAIEGLVTQSLGPLISHADGDLNPVRAALKRVQIKPHMVTLTLDRSQLREAHHAPDRQIQVLQRMIAQTGSLDPGPGEGELVLTLAVRMKLWGGRTWLVAPKGGAAQRAIRTDPALMGGLKRAHRILHDSGLAPAQIKAAPKAARAPANAYLRSLCRSALLAPDLQAMIFEGRQPQGLHLDILLKTKMPLAWEDQRHWIQNISAEGA
jgi:site-specific DNA recombinase